MVLLFMVVLLTTFVSEGMVSPGISQARIKAAFDDLAYEDRVFVDVRIRETLIRCMSRIPSKLLLQCDYCDREGTLLDHVRKEVCILRGDILSGDPERVSDLIEADALPNCVRDELRNLGMLAYRNGPRHFCPRIYCFDCNTEEINYDNEQ